MIRPSHLTGGQMDPDPTPLPRRRYFFR
ncbi:mgtA regulatory leader peptide MgtL [Kosakonia quasisacchari]|uniref:mgtA leader peptide n=1 Tax=Kosakonia quasisacchari TaxID=2529380 RepID=A0A4R0HWP9_9ENTR|nr:mgtA regulatory leader peptide MgtL [Kosakonia sacchari]QOV66251.1 mgtA regulatory leader peptide MgtL [Kosakonia pseudosacchari]TCC14012.1 mgtA regulatory leader peptide MgtL [Kosakonia quasisacchari]